MSSDQELLAAIRAGRAPDDGFYHRQHLRAGWLYLRREPFRQAVAHFCADLQRFATALGAPQMYHHSLSVAAMYLLAAAGANRHADFKDFLAEHPELLNDFRGCIGRHYSPELLASDTAKSGFVAPDREPLPSCNSAEAGRS